MKMECKGVFLGTENKVSSKGNSYTVVLFSQGTEAVNCMLDFDKPLNDLKLYTEHTFVLNYNARFRDIRCIEIK